MVPYWNTEGFMKKSLIIIGAATVGFAATPTTDFAVSVQHGKAGVVFTGLQACEHYIVLEKCFDNNLTCLNFKRGKTYEDKPLYMQLKKLGLMK